MSSEYYEHWLEEQDRLAAAEDVEWLKTPEGAAWKREHEKLRVAMEWSGIQAEKERMAAERARNERERQWRDDNPIEWAAWKRLQVVLEEGPILFGSSDEKPYDFPAFLAEVKPAPPGATYIEQKDVRVPFRPGNLRWAPPAGAASGPQEPDFMTIQQVKAATGYSYDYIRDAILRGDLPATKKARQYRIAVADYRAWMARDRVTNAPVPRGELQQTVTRHFQKRGR
jgi:hypothetical protein